VGTGGKSGAAQPLSPSPSALLAPELAETRRGTWHSCGADPRAPLSSTSAIGGFWNFNEDEVKSQVWWCTPVISALGRLRREEHEFRASPS
jgi:hypothetical protein